ncbi:MAG: bifunctional oligoribonuclease/PAP phosphatase NrnA [Bacteroidales bacterium]|nr:bifunctional oligoribonuclease/PAP phosphatase NrnA [Bacteroidales bacterium]MDD4685218.1 bifunctional oligoribonuclease/PAP phosphatase NrnA [Bacteroidales bacterium]
MIFSETEITELRNKIQESNIITLVSHFNPDGDTIGAATSFFHYLKSKNKTVKVVISNEYPAFLEFVMKDVPHIIGTKQFEEAKLAFIETDLIIGLDFNSVTRVGDMLKDSLLESNKPKVLIDHHLFPEIENFDLIYSKTNVSSTCELLYEVLFLLEGNNSFLNFNIAQSLYLGICTDTGSFSYACNERRVYEVVADLVDHGADVEDIHKKVYNTYSETKLRLLGFCLCERLMVFPKQGAAFIYLSRKDLRRFNYQIGDCEGIVNYCLSLEGIEFGALVTERPDRIRLSFRSKNDFDVNVFSRTYWNGAGHKKAAGGFSHESLDAVIERLTEQIKGFDLNKKNEN